MLEGACTVSYFPPSERIRGFAHQLFCQERKADNIIRGSALNHRTELVQDVTLLCCLEKCLSFVLEIKSAIEAQ
jgi:hypothetical protein